MAKAVLRHTRIALSTDQTIQDETLTTVLFDTVQTDTSSIFNSSSPGLLMVPNSSYTHAILTANVAWANGTDGDVWVSMIKNGAIDSGFLRGQAATIIEASTMERPRVNMRTGLLVVSSGDFFELQAWCNLGPDDVVAANNTFFEIELWSGSSDPGGGGPGGAIADGSFIRFFPGPALRFFPAPRLRTFPRP